MIEILFPAFIISVVLLGIHSYFGIRIIRRNIIFTDLAIGQMAALGAAVSLFFLHGEFMYLISLVFSIIAGLLISLSAKRASSLEAVIGLFYAMGLAGVFILLSKSPHGMEEFQNLMAYDILFTQMKDVYFTAVLYLIIGLFIYFYASKTEGFLNEILFFMTFAVTVTSSVRMAGVLVVFAVLLAPAFISIKLSSVERLPNFFKDNILITAWITGIIINLVSIVASYYGDFPTGYTLVFFNAFIAIIFSFLIRR